MHAAAPAERLDDLADRVASTISDLLGPDAPWTPKAAMVAGITIQLIRCSDCRRPSYAARPIASGRGPICFLERARP